MGNKEGESAHLIGPDELWKRRDAKVEAEMRQRREAAFRAELNADVLSDKKKNEAAHVEWQRAHDTAASALHEREVFFRDAIKSARHLGETGILVRGKQGVRSQEARELNDSPFSTLFSTCSSRDEWRGVAEAIEHWLGAQADRLGGKVWVEYDGKAVPRIVTPIEKICARESAEMRITWPPAPEHPAG